MAYTCILGTPIPGALLAHGVLLIVKVAPLVATRATTSHAIFGSTKKPKRTYHTAMSHGKCPPFVGSWSLPRALRKNSSVRLDVEASEEDHILLHAPMERHGSNARSKGSTFLFYDFCVFAKNVCIFFWFLFFFHRRVFFASYFCFCVFSMFSSLFFIFHCSFGRKG